MGPRAARHTALAFPGNSVICSRQRSFPDSVGDNTIVWMPRWQNLKNPREEKFIRGYSVYPGGGCAEYPWYATQAEGFGSAYKRDVKRRYPTPVSFTVQAPSLRSDSNFVDLDPEAKDSFGIPKARIHFRWGNNELRMFQHAKQTCARVLHSAGGVLEYAADE